jgi:hypothetical protein
MKSKGLLLFLLLAAISVHAQAAVLRVSANGSAPYSTITAAYTAAVNGDTLIIQPGAYGENIISTKRLKVIGAGFDLVSLTYWYFSTGSNGSLLEGVKVEPVSSYALYGYASTDSITVRRCLVRQSSVYPLYSREAGSNGKWITFEDCILLNNNISTSTDILSFSNDSCVVRNCVFSCIAAAPTALNALAGTPKFLVVQNSIFLNFSQISGMTGTYGCLLANNIGYDLAGTPSWGTFSPTTTYDYNASAGVAAPGTNPVSITANPFVNYNTTANFQEGLSDFHLTGASGLIDSGLPSMVDRDNSRSDFGIYGGPYEFVAGGAPDYPFVISLIVPSAIVAGDSLNVQSSGRIGPRY